MFDKEFWEVGSYVVTVIGLPVAIAIFLFQQRKERENEEEQAYQTLSDAYNAFLQVVLANPDLRLRSTAYVEELSDEQLERKRIIFEMLVSLFERAYLVAYSPEMSPTESRRWNSWEDYMREWCRREDFCQLLDTLLKGEDPDFSSYIQALAMQEWNGSPPRGGAIHTGG
jgi:type II secretory pathway pseudopilin PulG